ncbi:hypothetical protein CAGA_12530 [Caproiciproducens galactitolivorans]|uniref:Uncharacterized protein n=1 Tax=Caproiciproducens galactitolivorans TaxID=642589 RepID=A0A4Z0YCT1_9FIRM|nr:hypothetical protein CAGA_12530 [Caproiciproducens galactitolivorans]
MGYKANFIAVILIALSLVIRLCFVNYNSMLQIQLIKVSIILADADAKCYTTLKGMKLPFGISELLITADGFYKIVEVVSLFHRLRGGLIRWEALS